MQGAALLEALIDLARESKLEVRRVEAVRDEPPPTSAVCRVRGAVWVVLSAADPVDARIAVLAAALREHAGPRLEGRYLPPALRACLEEGAGKRTRKPTPPA